MSKMDWIGEEQLPDQALTAGDLRADKSGCGAFRSVQRRPITVVLDGIQQVYNIGAILRLCDPILVEKMVICGRSMDTGIRKLVQSAQGTQHWVPYALRGDTTGAVLDRRADGHRI